MNVQKIQNMVKKINNIANGFFLTVDFDYSTKKVLIMLNSSNYQKVVCETAKESLAMEKLQAI